MTRKHYVALAEIFRVHRNRALFADQDAFPLDDCTWVTSRVDDLISNVADYLSKDNGLFDRERFLSACGVTP